MSSTTERLIANGYEYSGESEEIAIKHIPESKNDIKESVHIKKADFSHKTLSAELLRRMDAYWRAANYLSVGKIYLYDNPPIKNAIKA